MLAGDEVVLFIMWKHWEIDKGGLQLLVRLNLAKTTSAYACLYFYIIKLRYLFNLFKIEVEVLALL